MSKNLSIRHRAEKRFIAYGFISLILAATMLATIIGSMIYRSIPAYTNYSIDLEINMTEISAEDEFEDINFRGIIRSSLFSFFNRRSSDSRFSLTAHIYNFFTCHYASPFSFFQRCPGAPIAMLISPNRIKRSGKSFLISEISPEI